MPMKSERESVLNKVAAGKLSVKAALRLLDPPTENNLGFARLDLDRHRRKGIPEVIYSAGKTPQQIVRTGWKSSR